VSNDRYQEIRELLAERDALAAEVERGRLVVKA
jgi:hypothetical protein